MEKTIEIPEGYEARIEGNKVILELKESEDEKTRKWLIDFISANGWSTQFDVSKENVLAWLEKQKEQKPILTKDEKGFLEKEVKAFLCNYDKEFDDDAPTYDIAEHFYQLGKNSQQPAEWSEEDKRMIDDIIYCLPRMAMGNIEMLPSVAEQYAQRLKSLRDNYKKCNRRWKPSEEQMRAVFDASERNDKLGFVLRNLYDDLKKL